jgi:hypothetical protein
MAHFSKAEKYILKFIQNLKGLKLEMTYVPNSKYSIKSSKQYDCGIKTDLYTNKTP